MNFVVTYIMCNYNILQNDDINTKKVVAIFYEMFKVIYQYLINMYHVLICKH